MPSPATLSARLDKLVRKAERDPLLDLHDDAMRCRDVEDGIAFMLCIRQEIADLDVEVRTAWAGGNRKYDPRTEKRLADALRGWVRWSKDLVPIVRRCRREFSDVARATEFLDSYRDAVGIVRELDEDAHGSGA